MKNLFITILLLILAIIGLISYLLIEEGNGVPILSYHQVNNIDKNQMTVTIEEFDEQIKYLVDSGYTFITPEELLDTWEDDSKRLPDKPIIITFDDGYIDMYKNVFPILQKYNAKATLFVITDYLNLYPSYLTWSQAREMQSSGLVDVESHTLSHVNLTDKYLSELKMRDQLHFSKQAIEWYLKKPAKFVAYPGGKYSTDVIDMSKDVGYRAAFNVDYGLAQNSSDNYVLPRVPVFGNNSYSFIRFKLRLIGAPVFSSIQHFKDHLIKDGNEAIADLIWIP